MYALLTIVLFLCLLIFFLFRSSSSSGLWKSYIVLITSSSTDEKIVLQELSSLSVTGVVSITSGLEKTNGAFSPISLAFTKEKISAFFSDKEQKTSLYYIPRKFEGSIRTAKKNSTLSFDFSLDVDVTLPPLSFMIVFAVSFFLLCVSHNKLIFFSLCTPFLVFTLCFQDLSLLPAILCLLYISFYIQKQQGRTELFASFMSHKKLIMLSIFTLVSLVCTPAETLLFVPFLLIASGSFYLLMRNIVNYFEFKKRFVPLLIFSSRYKKKEGGASVLMYLPAALSTIVCSIFLILYMSPSFFKGSVFLPAPEKSSKDISFSYKAYEESFDNFHVFPSLAHYVSDRWNVSVFPYTRVTEAATDVLIPLETTAGITRYKREETSIKSYYETLFTFDNTFIDSILEGIDNENSASILQVLYGQGTFSPILYKPVTSSDGTIQRLIVLSISCIFFLLLMYISYKEMIISKEIT